MSEEKRLERRQNDAEMYRTLGRIEGMLSGLDQKIDAGFTVVEKEIHEIKTTAKRTNERVGSLEVSRGWLIGAGAGAGGLVGWLTQFFK